MSPCVMAICFFGHKMPFQIWIWYVESNESKFYLDQHSTKTLTLNRKNVIFIVHLNTHTHTHTLIPAFTIIKIFFYPIRLPKNNMHLPMIVRQHCCCCCCCVRSTRIGRQTKPKHLSMYKDQWTVYQPETY